jgi:ubiquinone/menaquinone biosynthesis C-methylase UbiE
MKTMNNSINLTFEEQWSCISPYIIIDKNFKEIENSISKKIYKDCIKKIFLRKNLKIGQKKFNNRSENFVINAYNDKWISRDNKTSTEQGAANLAVTWNSSRFVVKGSALRKLQTLRIMKLIEKIKPRSVIDIGSGNGERVLQLSCRFPEIEFTGLELTPGGVETAKNIQSLDKIPDVLVKFSPQKLINLTAHKNAKFVCSSAKNIPFKDNSFDLVYSSLALEQMEFIREQVMKEIFRVSNKYVSFYEAFRDYNKKILHWSYIYSKSYFKGKIDDLRQLGFREIEVLSNIPQKVYMNAVFVIAKK